MEKRLEFKQTDSSRLKLLGITYFVLLMAFLLYATLGTHAIVNFINSLDYAVVGILSGVIFIGPLLLMLPFTAYRMVVVFDDEKIRVQSKRSKDTIIHYSSINKIYLNRKRLCELELFSVYSKPLYTFRSVNNGMAIEKIVTILTKKITFSKATTQTKRKGGTYPFITYTR